MRTTPTINDPERRAGFYGLDLYSLFTSADAVVRYLGPWIDPVAARVARERYGALTPVAARPSRLRARGGRRDSFESCEEEVVAGAASTCSRAGSSTRPRTGSAFFDAAQNARGGGRTPSATTARCTRGNVDVVEPSGPAHVRHARGAAGLPRPDCPGRGVGAQLASSVMRRRPRWGRDGEHNVGQLCRSAFRCRAPTSSGSGPTTGRWSPPRAWDEPHEIESGAPGRRPQLRRASVTSRGVPAFLLPLREPRREVLRDELMRAAARASHRRHLPARDGAAEPLLPGQPAPRSSTSGSGSTRPLPSIRSARGRRSKDCQRPILSVCDGLPGWLTRPPAWPVGLEQQATEGLMAPAMKVESLMSTALVTLRETDRWSPGRTWR